MGYLCFVSTGTEIWPAVLVLVRSHLFEPSLMGVAQNSPEVALL